MKTYYDLLSIERGADADTIKKAFRREIARYHPDKVIHLGAEFQEMAATRAAALTVAYKQLGDPVLRAQYDASIAVEPTGNDRDSPKPESPDIGPAEQPSVRRDVRTPPPPTGRRRFETERSGRDLIVRRAMTARARTVVESLYGAVDTLPAPGFDVALVPRSTPGFFRSHPPRVLVRFSEVVDATAVAEAWNAAARSGLPAGKSPVVVLLFGRQLPPTGELRIAIEAASRQRRPPQAPDELVVVAVNISDWTCHMPDDVSATVRKLIDTLRR